MVRSSSLEGSVLEVAARAAAVVSRDRGIREWLGGLPGTRTETAATTFDTRVASRITGSAARAASRRLDWLGYPLVSAPASFRVGDVTGPLIGGELDHAREWGKALGAEVAARRPSRPIP